ncbi:MAG TPA: hypothetical protein VGL26_08310, partial [Jatrophihabitans sp.]
MSLKKLSVAAVAAVLSVVGLSACTSKVGAAAYVGSQKISDKTVGSYASSVGPDLTKAANAGSPRVNALNELIQQDLFTKSLAATGGVPNESALQAAHDDAITMLVGSDQVGDAYDKAL